MTSTIGNVDLDTGAVTIYPLPKAATHQDGLKVDTISRVPVISPFQGHTFNTTVPATFIGTDDENYGRGAAASRGVVEGLVCEGWQQRTAEREGFHAADRLDVHDGNVLYAEKPQLPQRWRGRH